MTATNHKLTEHSVLQLAAGAMQRLQNYKMSPEAAFLLSRIDGNADLSTIGFMAGVPVDKVVELFMPLLQQGLLILNEPPVAKADAGTKKVGSILDLLEHEDLDPRYAVISKEFRNEVLLKFSSLGEATFYEVLGVAKNCSDADLKKSYFALSRKFHPDTYFSKDIGHYRKKISRIFEKVNTAYETLSDEKRRKDYDKSLKNSQGGKAAGEAEEADNPMVANMNRARRYFEWGEDDYQRGNYVSAASNYLLAINFDKNNDEYKKAHERVKPFVERRKNKELIHRGMQRFELGDYEAAWKIFDEVFKNSPQYAMQDGDFLLKSARAALLAGVDLGQADAYNKKGEALLGRTAYGLYTEGLIREKKKDFRGAVNVLKKAAEIDPDNSEIASTLKRLQKKVEKKQ